MHADAHAHGLLEQLLCCLPHCIGQQLVLSCGGVNLRVAQAWHAQLHGCILRLLPWVASPARYDGNPETLSTTSSGCISAIRAAAAGTGGMRRC